MYFVVNNIYFMNMSVFYLRLLKELNKLKDTKQKIRSLRRKLKDLTKVCNKISQTGKDKEMIANFFTRNERDLLMQKKKKVHWTSDEISKAFTLRYLSKRAYLYVRDSMKFPLPGLLPTI